MRWACILFPQMAMDGALRSSPDTQGPFVLVAGPPKKRYVQAVNDAARAIGLRPNQSLSAAQAIARDFTVAEYDQKQIDHWQRFLAAWAYRYSSHVSLDYPRTLLLEVQSSMGLFGPWPRFEARLRQELTELGFRHRIVAAPNASAARALANVHDGLDASVESLNTLLQAMPVDRCGFDPAVATAFKRMGLRKFRQVMALPRDTIARRFPREVLEHLDELTGRRAKVLSCYQPPDIFDMRIELNFDVESHQALLFPLRRVTSDLAAYLAGRDSGVQRFTLHLEHRDGPASQVSVGLLSAEREAGSLFELARGRLEQVQLPGATQAMRLIATDLPAFAPERKTLFDDRPQQNLSWEKLRERLRARLGDASVHGLQACADHRPERAWLIGEHRTSTHLALPKRPGWLIEQPTPVDDPDLRIIAGPERIESGWWDGGDVRRDYYLVQLGSGQLAWAYRAIGGSEA